MMQASADAGLEAKTRAAVDAFAAPYAIRFLDTGAAGSIQTGGTLESAALALGVAAISTELGGSGVVTPQTLAVGRAGVRNLMAHLGMIDAAANTHPVPAGLLQCTEVDQYVLAPRDGLWEPLVALGDRIAAGTAVCQLYDPNNPVVEPRIVEAQRDGVVIARRTPARCRQGDFLMITAREP
jgi:predicted deacylase